MKSAQQQTLYFKPQLSTPSSKPYKNLNFSTLSPQPLLMKRTLTTLLIGIALLHAAQAQVLTSSNLPIVVVNTGGQGIPNEPRVRAQMRIYYKGEGQRNSISDLNYHYNGLVG
jgi:hypothetical protein